MNDGFIQLKDLLPKIVSNYGVQREVRGAFVRDRARHAVRHIWGNEVDEIIPLYFKDGVLMIEVASSAWGQEVFMKIDEIKDLIGESEGLKDVVKSVKTRVAG